MTDASTPKPPLGVGTIISGSFGVYFANFLPFYLVVLVPALLMLPLNMDMTASMGASPDGQPGSAFWIFMAVSMAVYYLEMIVLVRMTGAARAGRAVSPVAALKGVPGVLAPTVLLYIVSSLAFLISMAFILLPGLWVGAVLSVTAPAVILGGAGFGGLGRSARLTKGYRWPIIGLFILFWVIFVVISLVVQAAQMAVFGVWGFAELSTASASAGIGFQVIATVLGMALFPVFFILPAMLFLRLRDIKEGGGDEALTDVFA